MSFRKFNILLLLIIVLNVLYCRYSYSGRSKLPTQLKNTTYSSQLNNLTVVKQIKPHHLIGDFNCDGNDDDLYIVQAKGPVSQLPSKMEIVDLYNGAKLSKHLILNPNKISFALLHSKKIENSFLIYDTNDVSVFDSLFSMELMVIKKSETSKLNAEYGINPIGDVIVVPTQAGIDTYLFWNGSSYQYFCPNEILIYQPKTPILTGTNYARKPGNLFTEIIAKVAPPSRSLSSAWFAVVRLL